MTQRKISFRLNTHITTSTVIIIAAIVLASFLMSKKVLIKSIEDGAINHSNLVIAKISRITIGTEEIAKNVSSQVLYYYQKNDLELFLKNVVGSNPLLESIEIELFSNDPDSINRYSTLSQSKVVCMNDPSWIRLYKENLKRQTETREQGIWTDPFYCKIETSHLLVAYIAPVYLPNSNELAGVVSCEISLRNIRKLLSDIKIGNKGYAFIIDKTGRFVTHPKADWVMSRNLFERPSSIFTGDINKIKEKINSSSEGAERGISKFLEKEKSWFYYSKLGNTGWKVIIVYPEKELYNEISAVFKQITTVALIGILILFLVNIIVFRKLLDPLERITRSIQKFSSTHGKISESKDEIRLLAESLENWQTKYGLLINEQKRTELERNRFEKDLKMAGDIQSNIVPSGNTELLKNKEIDLSTVFKPAETVGGDLYNYFFIDDTNLLIAIGDVSGKGIPASLFMAIASTLIKTHANSLLSNEIVGLVNNELSERNANQYFLTLFLGILNIETGKFNYCNAAHDYPYLLTAIGTTHTLSKSHGLPLGIYKDKAYKNSTIDLNYGDMLVLFTDGIINTRDISNRHYGIPRLEKNIRKLKDVSAEQAVNRIMKSVLFFEGDSQQSDDVTLMVLKYLHKTKGQN